MRQVIYTSCAGPGHQGRQARQCPMARQRRAPLNRTLLIISVGLYCQTVYITIVYIQLYFNPPGRKLSINLCQIITFTCVGFELESPCEHWCLIADFQSVVIIPHPSRLSITLRVYCKRKFALISRFASFVETCVKNV